jgi:hypothetical protein
MDNHDLLYRWRGAGLHRASDMFLCDESGDQSVGRARLIR